jgi:hypothetical protein
MVRNLALLLAWAWFAAAECLLLNASCFIDVQVTQDGVQLSFAATPSKWSRSSSLVAGILVSSFLELPELTAPLLAGNDTVWRGHLDFIPTALQDGDLVLLRLEVPDAPCLPFDHGFVIGADRIAAESAVAPMFVYSTAPGGFDGDTPTQAMVLFCHQPSRTWSFHRNVTIHRGGADRLDPGADGITGKSKDWPKKKLQMAFHGDEPLLWRNSSSPRASFASRRVELRSMYAESGPTSYMREALALRLFQAAGVPCADARYVRLFINNGTFHGLYLLTEHIDGDWLRARKCVLIRLT